jgi:hypothetical protein
MVVMMSMAVLWSTLSFSVDFHYCGDVLVDYSFNDRATSCGMEQKTITVSSCGMPEMSEKSCCTDKQFVKEGTDDLKISFTQLQLDQQIFLTAFTYSYLQQFQSVSTTVTAYDDYPPPFLERDVLVLHQTFLI